MNRPLLATALAAVIAACSGNESPCTSCPQMAGAYLVSINDSMSTASSGCATLGVGDPQGLLSISQQGAGLNGSYSGFSLTGTLYDSFDFQLSGFQADGGVPTSNNLALSARFVPAAPDAGASLVGSMSTQYQGTTGGTSATCTQYLPFTAYAQ